MHLAFLLYNVVMEKPSSHHRSVKKQLLVPLYIFIFLATVTTLAILYGTGYRLFFEKGQPAISKTGILHVKSIPTGAQVYINGHLDTATEDSINLTPGKYEVTIAKDGYRDWQKDFEIQKEVVQSADARLFPKAPTLQGISTFSVDSVVVDPSGTKLAFKVASQSARKNGVYVFDMTARTFPVLAGQSNSTQVADDTIALFSTADISWSPDGKQLLASVSGKTENIYYLLKSDTLNDKPQDLTLALKNVQDLWKTQLKEKETAQAKSLKPAVRKFAKEQFRILSWSPDENKILYQASSSAEMPVFTKPRLIGNNHLYERRDLEKNSIYVYDIKEDFNTRIVEYKDALCEDSLSSCVAPFKWFPDSEHLIYVHDKKIEIVEDDGSNMTTIYAGPFIGHHVFPWPDGSKLVILTNLNNQDVPPTLYSVGLK